MPNTTHLECGVLILTSKGVPLAKNFFHGRGCTSFQVVQATSSERLKTRLNAPILCANIA